MARWGGGRSWRGKEWQPRNGGRQVEIWGRFAIGKLKRSAITGF
jgi:hypothetical protein